MNDFTSSLSKYIKPDQDDLTKILQRFQKKNIKKGRFLIKAGQTSNEFMFIEKGCLRVFWQQEDKEITGWFAFEEDFFCELSSFIPQQASTFGVQAIEDTSILYITRREMEQLFQEVPIFETFIRKYWEEIIKRLVDNVVSFQAETAEKRYKKALEHPKLLHRVPLKYLSSFLGLTPTSLSRLRKLK